MSEQQFRPRPRGDFVIVSEVKVDTVRGVAVPEISAEAKRYRVESIGPKADNLKAGEIVLLNGQFNVHWSFIPNFPGLIIVRQECVILVLEPLPQESAYDQIHDHQAVS